jgi:hypothetical protein
MRGWETGTLEIWAVGCDKKNISFLPAIYPTRFGCLLGLWCPWCDGDWQRHLQRSASLPIAIVVVAFCLHHDSCDIASTIAITIPIIIIFVVVAVIIVVVIVIVTVGS